MLVALSTQLWELNMSPYIAKCPLRGKITLVESHWCKVYAIDGKVAVSKLAVSNPIKIV